MHAPLQLFAAAYKVLSLVAIEPKSQIAGCTTIVDTSGFSYKQFRSLSFDDIKVVAVFLQQGFPLWFRKLHFVNASRFFNMFFNLLKPFLAKEVRVCRISISIL